MVLSGCRTYGDFGAEAKTYRLLEETVLDFEENLDAAKQDLHKLEEAAADVESLHSMVDRYQSLTHEHEALLEKQRSRVERLSADAGYRDIHRAFGATVTEQRMMEQKYRRALKTIRAHVQDTPMEVPAVARLDRRYTVKPIGFPKKQGEDRLSMERVLGQ